jgi:type III secretory pathway component EscS
MLEQKDLNFNANEEAGTSTKKSSDAKVYPFSQRRKPSDSSPGKNNSNGKYVIIPYKLPRIKIGKMVIMTDEAWNNFKRMIKEGFENINFLKNNVTNFLVSSAPGIFVTSIFGILTSQDIHKWNFTVLLMLFAASFIGTLIRLRDFLRHRNAIKQIQEMILNEMERIENQYEEESANTLVE